MSNYKTEKCGLGKFKGQIHAIKFTLLRWDTIWISSLVLVPVLLNHCCKTQTALFNKKLNISGFEGMEILKVC